MDICAVDELLVDPTTNRSREPGSRVAADSPSWAIACCFRRRFGREDPANLRIPLRVLYRYPIPGFIAQFQHPLHLDDGQSIRESYFSEPAIVAETTPCAPRSGSGQVPCATGTTPDGTLIASCSASCRPVADAR